MIRTSSQRFAEVVFRDVSSVYSNVVSDNFNNLQKEYKSLVVGFPTMMRNCGLMQSLAFLMAKSNPQGPNAHYCLVEFLRRESIDLGLITNCGNLQFNEIVAQLELVDYMKLSRDILFLLQWHKRFTQALCNVEV